MDVIFKLETFLKLIEIPCYVCSS